jgi:hypothetical protein
MFELGFDPICLPKGQGAAPGADANLLFHFDVFNDLLNRCLNPLHRG